MQVLAVMYVWVSVPTLIHVSISRAVCLSVSISALVYASTRRAMCLGVSTSH